MIRVIGFLVLVGLLSVSILRGIGYLDGDFIIPLILLSQLVIAGYLYNLLQIISRYVLIRYNDIMNNSEPSPPNHTWN